MQMLVVMVMRVVTQVSKCELTHTPMKQVQLSETDSEMKILATITKLIKSEVEVQMHMYSIPNVII